MTHGHHYPEFLRRLADHHDGRPQPDPRTDELRDRGWRLLYRARVQRNETMRQPCR